MPKSHASQVLDVEGTCDDNWSDLSNMSPSGPGTTAILQWVEEAGLGIVPGLGDAFMAKAGSLDALSAMSDDDFQAVILSLKLRGISLRKVTAAFKTLQSSNPSKPSASEVRVQITSSSTYQAHQHHHRPAVRVADLTCEDPRPAHIASHASHTALASTHHVAS